MSKHFQVLVIGGGTAGIMVSSMLKRKDSSLIIGIIEPAETHYYQPAWTLVGANTFSFEDTAKPMASLIPKGVAWIKEFAEVFVPECNKVKTKDGNEFTYDYLVVAPGLRMAPELVEGLQEAMDKGVVCSNYTNPKHTWETLKNFKGVLLYLPNLQHQLSVVVHLKKSCIWLMSISKKEELESLLILFLHCQVLLFLA